ncbi:disintegrin and metalloproteinase domain-containing protein 32-like [Trichosurus vulpecula]|uniref:disintegrin and metalloproteinase domain-containing protein 32-like n=1 Tax=Trichosurus vulpecula TaxID=9337 RepID=UPI00186AC802|nr:disintegrin and metalloproteinase domain-containing protein 32-like [Trichosurus vulpecula]
MLYLLVLLAGLSRLLTLGLDFQQSFVEITVPEEILSNSSDSDSEYEGISYSISIEGRLYTLHLKKRLFLPDDFVVYMYSREGALYSSSKSTMKYCNYQGHIAGLPNSVVTLHACSGLRGLLQFENVTYGIEPLGSSGGFQHLIYRLRSENTNLAVLAENNTQVESEDPEYKVDSSVESRSLGPKLSSQYVEIHIVLDKGLYDYMGSDIEAVTNKVIQILGLINAMFTQFKMTIVLSSLELWTYKNKISTTGEPDDILQRFLEWKNSYLVLRPHDMAYLFIYREHPTSVGATFPGKMCVLHYAAGIVLYPKGITVEAFSVIIAQLLGLSLGIRYDDKRCHCSQSTCIMNPEAVLSSGIKVFSRCSLNDFQNFISKTGAKCLKNQPALKYYFSEPPASCGNYEIDEYEECDCGPPSVCGYSQCCNPSYCRASNFAYCITGVCCQPDCRFNRGGLCRPAYDPLCDFPEQCNGTSSECPHDLRAKDGSKCADLSSICYDGICQNPDKKCQRLFGKGSKNGPFACYEEINSQQDRFGNCGRQGENRFKFCNWRNLLCGKLICTYPYRKPYVRENVAVIYSFVLNTVCISLDHKFQLNTPDPMLMANGNPCDSNKFCLNSECVYMNNLIKEAKTCSEERCYARGACTDHPGICVCQLEFRFPDCYRRKTRATYSYSDLSSDVTSIGGRVAELPRKNWLLISFYISLPILFIIAIITVKWKSLKGCLSREESPITE